MPYLCTKLKLNFEGALDPYSGIRILIVAIFGYVQCTAEHRTDITMIVVVFLCIPCKYLVYVLSIEVLINPSR
jgi:hypothetical protein